MAKIPPFTASGRLSHASMTVWRSLGRSDTHMTHFSCKNVSFRRSDMCGWCSGIEQEAPTSVDFCGACVSSMYGSCSDGFMPKGGFEPPTLRQRSQHQRHTDPTSLSHFNALPIESPHTLTPESHPRHSAVRKMCAPSVPENSASLIAIIEACDWLSPKVRNQLVVILRTSRKR